MSVGVKRAALALVGAMTLGIATQASEINITIRSGDSGAYQRVSGYGYSDREVVERRHYSGRGYGYEQRDPDRYYGRPVSEHRRWNRPRYARSGWGQHDGCRLIIKRSVDRWGDLVVKRIKVCG
jgi:hypothetical protein